MGSRVRPRGRRLLGGPRPRRARLFRGERGVGALLVFGLLALSVSALTSYTLPRLVEWRRTSDAFPDRTTASRARPRCAHPDVDVVSVAVKPTCVTRVAVAALNQFVGPRRIHFVTADEARCEVTSSAAWRPTSSATPKTASCPASPNAPSRAELRRLHGLDADARYVGRETSGWYLQQLVKLGAARARPEPLRNLPRVGPGHDRPLAHQALRRETWRHGRTPRFAPRGRVRHTLLRTLVPSAHGRRDHRRAPDGSSYVTHQMTMRREYVKRCSTRSPRRGTPH